jgi:hypothetical protein
MRLRHARRGPNRRAVAFRLLPWILLPLSMRSSEQQVLPLGQHLIYIVQRERRGRGAFPLGWCLDSELANGRIDVCANATEVQDCLLLSDCRQDQA